MIGSSRAPGWAWCTFFLVAGISGIFLWEVWLGFEDQEQLSLVFQRWALVPVAISRVFSGMETPAVLVTLLTSVFLHAGWLHVLLNLVYLAVFGTLVEHQMTSGRFLGLFFACGVAAGLALVLTNPGGNVPTIGASGAVAGVLGASLALAPGATVGSAVPMLFFRPARHAPVLLLLLIWFAAQVLSGLATVAAVSTVAWSAHGGGFLCGLVLAPLLRTRRRLRW